MAVALQQDASPIDLLWPFDDQDGQCRPARTLGFDPVFEAAKRSIPLEIGPRQPLDLSAIEHVNNEIEVQAAKNLQADLKGGRHYIEHSETRRQVTVISEEGDTLTLAVSSNTRVYQVQEMVGGFLGVDQGIYKNLELSAKHGSFWKTQYYTEEVGSRVRVKGVKNFARPRHEFDHTLMILGAGIGGMVIALKLLQRGRTDIQMFEKLHDFGGGSWYHIANKNTKLQTEAGSYHLSYYFEWLNPPDDLPTWPSRDHVCRHFQKTARHYDLDKVCMFNTKVTKIKPKGEIMSKERWYSVAYEPADEEGDVEILQAGAAFCWPGNLCTNKLDEYPGEEEFGGYIQYASLNKPDYTQVAGKDTVIIGHGAFAIENVRTCLEYDCHKMTVLCRRRNITAPKPISWCVTSMASPMPGPVMMDAIQKAYDLIDWDVWGAYSVTTDAKRSYCRVDQGTMFGVTDVYFICGYYGLMDVVVGDVKRLTYQCIHLKTNKKIHCEALLKTVGVRGSNEVDKMLGLKELVGFWVNGDPWMPCITNTLFVQASNFAGYSIGPGVAGEVDTILWFADYPQDFMQVKGLLPVHNAKNNPISGNSLYVYTAQHSTNTSMVCGSIPGLALNLAVSGSLKWKKQQRMHSIDDFLKECRAEWDMYSDMCMNNPASRDRPRPAYPYSKEYIIGLVKASGCPVPEGWV